VHAFVEEKSVKYGDHKFFISLILHQQNIHLKYWTIHSQYEKIYCNPCNIKEELYLLAICLKSSIYF
jgi:hypothetical protein